MRETQEIDEHTIELVSKEFLPSKKEDIPEDKMIVFLPGWSAGGAKTLDTLCQELANNAKSKSLSIQTRSDVVDNEGQYLYREARAIKQLFIEKGLKKITLAAHSEGGIKAADLIDILQNENPEIAIEGLILLDPVGLYEQGSWGLAKNFAKDALINTPRTVLRDLRDREDSGSLGKSLQAANDIIFSIAKEIGRSGADYKKRLESEIATMARVNNHYADVRCPVVLITGANDPVSSADQILSGKKEEANLLAERRQILKDTLFPNSPQVDILVPEKYGHHGLPHFRSEQIAKVAPYLIERYRRTTNSTGRGSG